MRTSVKTLLVLTFKRQRIKKSTEEYSYLEAEFTPFPANNITEPSIAKFTKELELHFPPLKHSFTPITITVINPAKEAISITLPEKLKRNAELNLYNTVNINFTHPR